MYFVARVREAGERATHGKFQIIWMRTDCKNSARLDSLVVSNLIQLVHRHSTEDPDDASGEDPTMPDLGHVANGGHHVGGYKDDG